MLWHLHIIQGSYSLGDSKERLDICIEFRDLTVSETNLVSIGNQCTSGPHRHSAGLHLACDDHTEAGTAHPKQNCTSQTGMPWRATGLRNLRNNSLSNFRSFRLTVDHCSDSSSMLTCSNTGRELVKNRIFMYSLFVGDFRKEVWRLLLALVQVEITVCD